MPLKPTVRATGVAKPFDAFAPAERADWIRQSARELGGTFGPARAGRPLDLAALRRCLQFAEQLKKLQYPFDAETAQAIADIQNALEDSRA